MAVVYRYIDLLDNIVKYVGIVYSDNRSLDQRISEHENDVWCKQSVWRIEYLDIDINSRTDAEMLEAHFISKFGTDKYFNKCKANWGTSQFVDENLFRWSVYKDAEIKTSTIVIAPFFF